MLQVDMRVTDSLLRQELDQLLYLAEIQVTPGAAVMLTDREDAPSTGRYGTVSPIYVRNERAGKDGTAVVEEKQYGALRIPGEENELVSAIQCASVGLSTRKVPYQIATIVKAGKHSIGSGDTRIVDTGIGNVGPFLIAGTTPSCGCTSVGINYARFRGGGFYIDASGNPESTRQLLGLNTDLPIAGSGACIAGAWLEDAPQYHGIRIIAVPKHSWRPMALALAHLDQPITVDMGCARSADMLIDAHDGWLECDLAGSASDTIRLRRSSGRAAVLGAGPEYPYSWRRAFSQIR
ncbi:MAG: hypothetical protein SOS98_00945 [Varibaculum sp.]|nr:hypothetical protein [Varibaculum sp.]